jgi:hypothetical protein
MNRLALLATVALISAGFAAPASAGFLQKMLGTEPSYDELRQITAEQVGSSPEQIEVSNRKVHPSTWTWDAKTPRGSLNCSMDVMHHDQDRHCSTPSFERAQSR